MARVSAVLVCLNIEKEIDRCLGSVAWCDEIVVVDSFSSDRTVERARSYTDRIFQHEYPGYSRQVERALGYATGEWVFLIDGDEECSPELATQCRKIAAGPPPGPGDPVGYTVLRRVNAFGRWIDHSGFYPEYKFRFFRRDRAQPVHREVHGAITTDGPVGRLGGRLCHYAWTSVYGYMQRLNNYTSLEVANRLHERPGTRVAWPRVVFSPVGHFLRRFVRKGGWRDGFPGLAIAVLEAMSTAAIHLKLWEYRMREAEGGGELPPITNEEINAAKRNF